MGLIQSAREDRCTCCSPGDRYDWQDYSWGEKSIWVLPAQIQPFVLQLLLKVGSISPSMQFWKQGWSSDRWKRQRCLSCFRNNEHGKIRSRRCQRGEGIGHLIHLWLCLFLPVASSSPMIGNERCQWNVTLGQRRDFLHGSLLSFHFYPEFTIQSVIHLVAFIPSERHTTTETQTWNCSPIHSQYHLKLFGLTLFQLCSLH